MGSKSPLLLKEEKHTNSDRLENVPKVIDGNNFHLCYSRVPRASKSFAEKKQLVKRNVR
jgi:hypothetical protein